MTVVPGGSIQRLGGRYLTNAECSAGSTFSYAESAGTSEIVHGRSAIAQLPDPLIETVDLHDE
jgi:hypothetical protein